MKQKFVAMYEHEYGVNTYVFEANAESIQDLLDNIQTVLAALGIEEFDEERENIHFDYLPLEIQTVML